MKKRVISSVIVAIVAALMTICSQNAVTPQKGEIKHFTAFFTTQGETIDSSNEMRQLIAEKIGADCEETWLVGQTKDNALNSYIASGNYPDFISGEVILYNAGALIPIDEYWDAYPNIKNYLTKEQWDMFRQEDGHIYWIPQFGVTRGDDIELTHSGEAFWIQTRVLKWAGYPQIHTVDEYFNLIEAYVSANPVMENGTENIPFTVLCDDWRFFCLENVPQFLDGYPNDGSCIVDPETLQVIDYNTTETARRYFKKLNEEYHKEILEPEAFLSTYEEYLDKLSTGAVLGMVDQWWQFYYTVISAYEANGLNNQGYNYVPLPITMEEGTRNQWHTTRSAELNTASGISITTSCQDIEGAMQFLNDLLDDKIIKLRNWGVENIDYSVDENGLFYFTEEQRGMREDKERSGNYFCPYSFFPRLEGLLPDGINSYLPEEQPAEFIKNQPSDIQECFRAYGVENYVDLLGNNEEPGSWYPMYSYNSLLSSGSDAGKVRDRLDEIKKSCMPQVIMAEDFDSAWEEYMEDYEKCQPEIYFQDMQKELERRVK